MEQQGLGKYGGWRSKGVGEGAEEKRRVKAENKPASAPRRYSQILFSPSPPFLPTPLFISSKFCNRVHTGFLLQNSQILRSFPWTKLLLSQKHSLNPKYTLVLFLHYPAFGPISPPAADYPWTIIIKFPRP